jgi:GTPase SAR1 family protein
LTTSYYRAASAAVLFFDLTNKQSFDNIQRWKQEVTEGSNSNTSGTPVTFIMVGTKTDLTAERVVSPEQAASLAERIGVKYFEASSKDNIGIAESVEGLVQELLEAEGIKVASD